MRNKISNNLIQLCELLSANDKINLSGESFHQIVQLANKQRVSALLLKRIEELKLTCPKTELEVLKENASKAKFKMMLLMGEAIRLNELFDLHGVKHLFIKGPIQSFQIFGDYTLKHSRDLDILIDEDRIEETISLLEQLQYELVTPYKQLRKKQKLYFLKNYNQLLFYNRNKNTKVELHWALFSNRELLDIPFKELYREATAVEVSKVEFKTLGDIHILLYLLAHGSKHAWSKLYWLNELVAFIQSKKIKAEEINKEVKYYGLEKMMSQFILLTELLYSYRIDYRLTLLGSGNNLLYYTVTNLERDEKNLALKAQALQFLYRISLKSDFGYKLSNVRFISINDILKLNLPDSLFFLYYPFRPLLLLSRLLG